MDHRLNDLLNHRDRLNKEIVDRARLLAADHAVPDGGYSENALSRAYGDFAGAIQSRNEWSAQDFLNIVKALQPELKTRLDLLEPKPKKAKKRKAKKASTPKSYDATAALLRAAATSGPVLIHNKSAPKKKAKKSPKAIEPTSLREDTLQKLASAKSEIAKIEKEYGLSTNG